MKVEYSGWSEERGSFHYDFIVDETKLDYEVHFGNGRIAKQNGPFEYHTADWNCDDDIYTQFGAWFQFVDVDGKFNGGEFFTPEDLVSFAISAAGIERSGPKVLCVKGLEWPEKQSRCSLDERILRSDQRAANIEADRNRRMDALGIRPSNEPWAR